jgi:hypothetical protein
MANVCFGFIYKKIFNKVHNEVTRTTGIIAVIVKTEYGGSRFVFTEN